jgi:hypothetical protein
LRDERLKEQIWGGERGYAAEEGGKEAQEDCKGKGRGGGEG